VQTVTGSSVYALNEYMALRTPDLLAVLGDRSGLDVLLQLVADDATVGALAKRTRLPQATVSRRIADLERLGVVSQSRRKQPWRLNQPKKLVAVLSEASELASQLLELDRRDEAAFRRSLEAALRRRDANGRGA